MLKKMCDLMNLISLLTERSFLNRILEFKCTTLIVIQMRKPRLSTVNF